MAWRVAFRNAWRRDVLRRPIMGGCALIAWLSPTVPPILLFVIGVTVIDWTLTSLGGGIQASALYARWGLDGQDTPAVPIFQVQMAVATWILAPAAAIAGGIVGFRAIGQTQPNWRGLSLRVASVVVPAAGFIADIASNIPLYERIGTRFFASALAPRFNSANWIGMLDWMLWTGNLANAWAAFALVFALLAAMRNHLAAEACLDPEGAEKRQTAYVAHIRNLFAAAALVLSSGILHMTSWRFLPLASLHDAEMHALYKDFMTGSVIMHGALFTGVLFAMFAPPVAVLRVSAADTIPEGIIENARKLRDVGVALAPFATALAAALIPA